MSDKVEEKNLENYRVLSIKLTEGEIKQYQPMEDFSEQLIVDIEIDHQLHLTTLQHLLNLLEQNITASISNVAVLMFEGELIRISPSILLLPLVDAQL